MANFNLSADIEIQKIVGSDKLQKELSQVLSGVKINSPKFGGTGNLAKALNTNTVLDLKIRLAITNPVGVLDSVFGKNRLVSVKLNVTNLADIHKLIGGAAVKVKAAAPVTGTAAGAAGLSPSAMATIATMATSAAKGVEKVTDKTKTAKERAKELLETFIKLADAPSSRGSGGFFDTLRHNAVIAKKDVDKLITSFKGLGNDDGAIKNFIKSLELIFSSLKHIESQRDVLKRIGADGGGAISAGLDNAQGALLRFLDTLETSNPNTLGSQFRKILKPYNEEVSKAIRDTQDYKKLLNELASKKITTISSGAIRGGGVSPELKVINDQEALAKKFRSAGLPADDIRIRLTSLKTLGTELDTVRRSGNATNDALDNLLGKKIISGVFTTIGSTLIDAQRQVTTIIRTAQKGIKDVVIAGTGDIGKRDIGKIDTNAKAQIALLETNIVSANAAYDRLVAAFTKFNVAGLDAAKNSVQSLAVQILRLVKSGASVETIATTLSKGLIKSDKIGEDERRINSMSNSLDRLKASLLGQQNPEFDLFGVEAAIVRAQARIKGFGGNLTPERETKLKGQINDDAFDARALNKANTILDNGINKLQELGIAAKTPHDEKIFKTAAEDFFNYGKTIAKSSGSARDKVRELEVRLVTLTAIAKQRVDGGLLNSIAKQAGLAAKRLAGFLIVGPAFFALGDGIRQAASSAVSLETNFTKLEQVFSKTFKSEEALIKVTSELRAQVFGLSKEFGVASEDIIQATRLLGQAGIVGNNLASSIEAITKAQLGATFNDIAQTSEALIAIFAQFNKSGQDAEAILGGINQVSSKFAVEAEGIAKGVRKAGAAFRASGGSLDEFIGAFTVLKSKTREADEALGTAIRTISNRLQRAKTRTTVKDILGFDLRDAAGQFIGFDKAIEGIGTRIKELGLSTTSVGFNDVVESIAGQRQRARLLPLITDYKVMIAAQKEFAEGAGSLDKDAALATDNFANKIQQLRAAFTELFSAILESAPLKGFLTVLVDVTKILTSAIKALGDFKFLFASLGALALPNVLSKGVRLPAFLETFGVALGVRTKPVGAAKGGHITKSIGLALGGTFRGKVPGHSYIDDWNARLAGGEYVFDTRSVDKLGAKNLERLHKIGQGKLPGFAKGGYAGGGLTSGGGGGAAIQIAGLSNIQQSLTSVKQFAASINTVTPALKPLSGRLLDFGAGLLKTKSGLVLIGVSLLGLIKTFSVINSKLTEVGVTSGDLAQALGAAALAAFLFQQSASRALPNIEEGLSKAGKFLKGKSGTRKVPGGLGRPATIPGGRLSTLANKIPGAGKFGGLLGKASLNIAKFSKAMTGVGVAIVATETAVGFLTDSIKAAANETIKNAKTEAEALKALDNIGGAEALNSGVSAAATIGGFAVAGAVGGPLGVAAGAAVGVIVSQFDKIKNFWVNSGIGGVVSETVGTIVELWKSMGRITGQVIGFIVEQLNKIPFVKEIGASIVKFGATVLELFENAEDEFVNAQNAIANKNFVLAGVDVNQLKDKNQKNDLSKNTKEFTERFNTGFEAALKAAGNDIEKLKETNPRAAEGATNFSNTIIDLLQKGDLTAKQLTETIDPAQLELLKKNFEKLGIDLGFDKLAKQQLAFSKLSSFLANMGAAVDGANSQLSNIESSLSAFSERFSEDPKFRLQKTDLNNLDTGFVPPSDVQQELDQMFKNFQKFNARAAGAANLEVSGKQIARSFSDKVRTGQAGTFDTGVTGFKESLKSNFADSTDNTFIADKFDDFIDSLDEGRFSEAIANGLDGQIIQKIINEEFTGSFTTGGLEAFKRFNDVQDQFTDQFKNLADRRLAIEGKMVEGVSKIVDLQFNRAKLLDKIQGREVLTTSKLAKERAATVDRTKGASILEGTGLSTNSSASSLESFIRQSKAEALSPKGSSNQEKELNAKQSNINADKATQFLTFIAGGTAQLSRAAEAFEERAKRSQEASEQFKKSLFGTDEEVLSTAKALQNMQKILSAGSQGEARQILSGLGSKERAGLQNLTSDQQKRIDQTLGVTDSVDLSGTQEAQDLIGATNNQIKAQESLNTGVLDAKASIDALVVALTQNQASSLNQAMVDQFSTAATQLNEAASKFPHEIQAVVNGTIQIVVTGGGGQILNNANPELQEMVRNEFKKGLSEFNKANANQFSLPATQTNGAA